MAKAPKTYSVELIFDDEDAAHAFTAYWLDGGGDGGGNIAWSTDKWDTKNKACKWMRIKGTGNQVCCYCYGDDSKCKRCNGTGEIE